MCVCVRACVCVCVYVRAFEHKHIQPSFMNFLCCIITWEGDEGDENYS